MELRVSDTNPRQNQQKHSSKEVSSDSFKNIMTKFVSNQETTRVSAAATMYRTEVQSKKKRKALLEDYVEHVDSQESVAEMVKDIKTRLTKLLAIERNFLNL